MANLPSSTSTSATSNPVKKIILELHVHQKRNDEIVAKREFLLNLRGNLGDLEAWALKYFEKDKNLKSLQIHDCEYLQYNDELKRFFNIEPDAPIVRATSLDDIPKYRLKFTTISQAESQERTTNRNSQERYSLRPTPVREFGFPPALIALENHSDDDEPKLPKRGRGRPKKTRMDIARDRLLKDVYTHKAQNFKLVYTLKGIKAFFAQHKTERLFDQHEICRTSEPVVIQKVPWMIRVYCCTDWSQTAMRRQQKSQRLGVFLHTSQDEYGARYPVQAKISIIAQKGMNKSGEFVHEFGRRDTFGYEDWLSTKQILAKYYDEHADCVKFKITGTIGRRYEFK